MQQNVRPRKHRKKNVKKKTTPKTKIITDNVAMNDFGAYYFDRLLQERVIIIGLLGDGLKHI